MKNQEKTFWGGMLAILLGTSCCWISSLAIWAGSASIIGLVAKYTESLRLPLITLGIMLLFIASLKYFKSKKS